MELLRKEQENPGVLSRDEIFNYNVIMQQSEGLSRDSILIEIGTTKINLTNLYEKEFRELLSLKGSTFKFVMDEIDKCSMNILYNE